MNIDLSGKVALVTASTGGIGFAIAKGLAASGAEAIVNGRSERSVNAAIARLQSEVPGAKTRPGFVFPARCYRPWYRKAGVGWFLSLRNRHATSRRI